MRAKVGDRIVIRGHRVGQPTRDCEVIEVRGTDDGPPYRVRWGDDGHESVFFPGPDAIVAEPPSDAQAEIDAIVAEPPWRGGAGSATG